MTLKQKVDYLLANGYTSNNDAVYPRFSSSNGQYSYTLRDLLHCWESITI